MSILIKGIDMPKDIDELRLIINGTSIAIEPTKAIQIPTPHGRLIDADALFEAMVIIASLIGRLAVHINASEEGVIGTIYEMIQDVKEERENPKGKKQ